MISTNSMPIEHRKSISVNENQVKNYNKIKLKDQERKSKRLSQQDITTIED